MEEPEDLEPEINQGRRKRKRLSEKEKLHVVAFANFHRDPESKKIRYGGNKLVRDRFGLGESSVTQILKEYDSQEAIYPTMAPKSRKECGMDSSLTEEVKSNLVDLLNMVIIEELELNDVELAQQYDVEFGVKFSPTTIRRYLKILGRTTTTLTIKPLLGLMHRIRRLEFILELIVHQGHGSYGFIDLKFEVHVDEKWFYVVKLKKRYRLVPGCIAPKHDTITHKSHIPKVMFLSVIGVPSPDNHFDGKVGIFVFGEYIPAARNSRNRAAGTPVFTDISITAAVYQEMFTKVGGVMDMIKQKMAWAKQHRITIRQDGAGPHTAAGTENAINAVGALDGWNIEVHTQPAQSPDMNKNDLCFFASLQKRANVLKGDSKKVEDLIVAVKQAYNDYDPFILTRIHAIQYEIYRQILADEGGNQYKLPHSGVRNRQNHGEDVADLRISTELRNLARAKLDNLNDQLD